MSYPLDRRRRRARFSRFVTVVAAVVSSGFYVHAWAARSSASYSVPAETTDAAGTRVTSASYSFNGSAAGEFGAGANAFASSAGYAIKAGYVGDLFEIVGLSATAPPSNTINESSSKQLVAAPLADDGTTTTPLDPSTVSWSIVAGPITSISSSGVATAATVYQNSAASVTASAQGNSAQLNLTVVNINSDDYGAYAGDGIDDSWQQQYFGAPPNASAAPAADPDGDGQNNLFEFTAGLVPTDAKSHFALSVSSIAGLGMQLVFQPIVSGRAYTVQYTSNLKDPNSWATLTGASQTDNGNQRTVTDSSAPASSRFYRVLITKP